MLYVCIRNNINKENTYNIYILQYSTWILIYTFYFQEFPAYNLPMISNCENQNNSAATDLSNSVIGDSTDNVNSNSMNSSKLLDDDNIQCTNSQRSLFIYAIIYLYNCSIDN